MADKKPKVGDVVGWVVVDSDMNVTERMASRSQAREEVNWYKKFGGADELRIAKIVLSK